MASACVNRYREMGTDGYKPLQIPGIILGIQGRENGDMHEVRVWTKHGMGCIGQEVVFDYRMETAEKAMDLFRKILERKPNIFIEHCPQAGDSSVQQKSSSQAPRLDDLQKPFPHYIIFLGEKKSVINVKTLKEMNAMELLQMSLASENFFRKQIELILEWTSKTPDTMPPTMLPVVSYHPFVNDVLKKLDEKKLNEVDFEICNNLYDSIQRRSTMLLQSFQDMKIAEELQK